MDLKKSFQILKKLLSLNNVIDYIFFVILQKLNAK